MQGDFLFTYPVCEIKCKKSDDGGISVEMKEQEKKKTYKATSFALYLLGAAVALQIIEYVVKQQNMEFRTFMQVIKGIYQWLIVPVTLVFSIYHDFFRKKSKAYTRYLLPTILTIFIVIASGVRGIYYFFTMTDETVMEDGIIRGSISTLSGKTYVYYEPVLGVFRKPFEGWSDEELAEKLKQRHGDGISLVETAENEEYRIYSAPSSRQGREPFYFRVWGTYEVYDNFAYSLMKSDAVSFWKSDITSFGISRQDRFSGFKSVSEIEEKGEESGQWNTRDYPGKEDWLVICCYSRADAPDCAADIADWIFYAASDERYFGEQGNYSSGNELLHLCIKFYSESGCETRKEYLDSSKDAVEENNWQEVYEGIEAVLVGYYNKLDEQLNACPDENADESMEITPKDIADWEEGFMEQYQGDYEKEIFLEGGKIGYRMVVTDAALGSRCYALLKSTDGGESWQMESGTPFPEMGQGIDFTFLNEKLGFATLSHNGGDEAYLFVTENGGKSYEKAVMQGITVTLDDGITYNPYDYPKMPYEEDGKLYVLCGQGMDGDYNGGDAAGMALFESTDYGHIFVYKGIQTQK